MPKIRFEKKGIVVGNDNKISYVLLALAALLPLALLLGGLFLFDGGDGEPERTPTVTQTREATATREKTATPTTTSTPTELPTNTPTLVVNTPNSPIAPPTATPTVTPTSEIVDNEAEVEYHVVQQGESLWSIAGAELGNPRAYPTLQAINEIEPCEYIHPGQVIKLR